jgi:hypothetical protein
MDACVICCGGLPARCAGFFGGYELVSLGLAQFDQGAFD